MKKGFTLIELLAVIIILAIIALIATQVVMGVIENAKKSSLLISAENYISAVEMVNVTKITNTNETYNLITCYITNDANLDCQGMSEVIEVPVSGTKPISGNIIFEDEKITKVRLVYEDGVIITGENGELVFEEINYTPIDDHVHSDGKDSIEPHDIYSGECTKCGKTVAVSEENENFNYVLVSTSEDFKTIIKNNSGPTNVYIQPGNYNLTEGIYLNNLTADLNLIGLGTDEKNKVTINTGTTIVKTTQAPIGEQNSAPIVIWVNESHHVTFSNLTLTNSSEATNGIVVVIGGKVTFDNVSILNNGTRYAINAYKVNQSEEMILNFNNSYVANLMSSNKSPVIQVRLGVVSNITNNTRIESEQVSSPTVTIEYGSSDAGGPSTINLDNTITSKHGNVLGVVIYSATPSSKWVDIIKVNGTQLLHNDSSSKGGVSTISGWKAYDANEWDISILGTVLLDYNGYVYTDNENLDPDDYLSLFG